MLSNFFQVIRTTGFMKGLYGEAEMKSDNVKVNLFQTVCHKVFVGFFISMPIGDALSLFLT